MQLIWCELDVNRCVSGVNAQVRYSIVSGDDLGWFEIGESTGLVRTARALDHEAPSTTPSATGSRRHAGAGSNAVVVILRIAAQDGGSPTPYTAYTNLTVAILDENDEVPTFEQDEFEVSLQEGAPPGEYSESLQYLVLVVLVGQCQF